MALLLPLPKMMPYCCCKALSERGCRLGLAMFGLIGIVPHRPGRAFFLMVSEVHERYRSVVETAVDVGDYPEYHTVDCLYQCLGQKTVWLHCRRIDWAQDPPVL